MLAKKHLYENSNNNIAFVYNSYIIHSLSFERKINSFKYMIMRFSKIYYEYALFIIKKKENKFNIRS